MTHPYHLLNANWLPVSLSSGHRELIRLSDISRPDVVAVATGRPDCDISLTEFLIGMVAVACPPRNDDAWRAGFAAVPSEAALEAAFAPFVEALMLDGDGPRFFQDLENLEGEGGPISGLLIDAPGASTLKDNADHFVKRGRTNSLSRAGAAIVLATLHTQAPSGGAGHRTSLRGGGPLTTLVVPGGAPDQAHRLWRTIWANVPTAAKERPEPQRVLPWLCPTRVSDRAGVSTTPSDVDGLQAFFGMPRRIRLVFEPNVEKRPCDLLGIVDDVIVTRYVTRPWGANYEHWSRGHRLSPYYKTRPTDPEFLPVHLKSSRVGYRDWLFIAVGDKDDLRAPANCVFDFRHRLRAAKGDLVTVRRNARMLVAGYAMDNMKPLDFGEALMPLIVGASEAANVEIKEQANKLIKAAEEVASQLTTAVRIGLFGDRAKVDGDSSVLRPVRDRFWADTEQAFFDALRGAAERFDIDDQDAMQDALADIVAETGKAWLAVLGRHAERVFDDTVPIDNAESRRIADIVRARRQLKTSLDGYGTAGRRIFAALGLPEREKRAKSQSQGKGRSAA